MDSGSYDGRGGWYYPTTTTGWSGWNTTTIAQSSGTLTVVPNYPSAVTPREKAPLEWLDAEIERVCELAR